MSRIVDECLKRTLSRTVEKPKPGWYYPSLLPSCLRRQFFIYREGHAISLEKSGIFKIGELFHEFLTGALKSEETLTVESEKPVILAVKHGDKWVRLSGRIDVLLNCDSVKTIVEVKSISKLPEKPLEHHVMQIQPYMLALGVEKAILVYLEKISLSWRIFEVGFNQELLEKVLRRAVMLDEALTEDRALKPEPSWECRYCEFKERCEAGK
jgi:CRISPR/Cas system-associated exonuclease Cas4 (RecB family)